MSLTRSLVVLGVLASAAVASYADSIEAGAVAATVVGPSADSFSLASSDASFGPTFTQSGTFDVGDSGSLVGSFAFSFTDNVTVDGVSRALQLFGEDDVTLTADTLSIAASGPIQIGDATYSLRSFDLTGDNIQPYDIALTADIQRTVTPEPAGLMLLGTGAMATALTVRRRLYALG